MKLVEQQAQQSVLVVVEGDAACPYWMDHWGPAPELGWSMLEQEEWEPAGAFSERLDAALDRAVYTAGSSEEVVLVTGGRTDAEAMAARWSRASALCRHLAAVGGGQLVLTRGFGHDGREEPELSALAEDLAEEWEDSGITICVRLDAPPAPVSRIRTASRPPQASWAHGYEEQLAEAV